MRNNERPRDDWLVMAYEMYPTKNCDDEQSETEVSDDNSADTE